jgi:predicted metal-binding protein
MDSKPSAGPERPDSGSSRPIDPGLAHANLSADAERYRGLALEGGADVAEIIRAADIPVDDRVLLKCMVPKCSGYNTSANCPPHTPTPEQTRGMLAAFDLAVVFRLPVPPDIIVRDSSKKDQLLAIRHSLYRLVSKIESAAFYDGHYFAAGLSSGSCKTALCPSQPCAVLAGEACRHRLRARPAMEAMGIDCFALACALGWEVFPIGSTAKADQVPSAFLMGAVLIG